jgi:hypothetical protein
VIFRSGEGEIRHKRAQLTLMLDSPHQRVRSRYAQIITEILEEDHYGDQKESA